MGDSRSNLALQPRCTAGECGPESEPRVGSDLYILQRIGLDLFYTMVLPPILVTVGHALFGFLQGLGLFDREKGRGVNRKVRNALRGLVQRYGTADIKKSLWDREFASGRWDCLDSMAEDCLYSYVEKYAKEGSILDLGCGPGSTGNELNGESYGFYTGVDISDVAIEKARSRTERNHRSAKNEYFQSDIHIYVPARSYDVIVFGDSIYYVPEPSHSRMLGRYSDYLNQGGVFIVRIKGERPAILTMIESQFLVIEKQLHWDLIWVIVFRQR